MEDTTISVEEMIEFIYIRCAGNISKNEIEMILDLQEEFLASKGLIQIKEDEIY
ncbi:hypothetical protein K0040_14855 [Terrisporobacter petrolearius]|uniref:hypothetical protein n=1 Tax=Terrisporobacter petrolearius TaxID=1460447 RepID=UPI001D168358|nr:hypothetical protein [Terrisporobacter petrolearius]MCC3865541.1 hypothetical protein [Terrisporobacter petrolearius]